LLAGENRREANHFNLNHAYSMSSESLTEALVEQLQDLLDAETQLVKALPKMADAAKNDKLRAGFTDHLAETKGHVDRLEQAFRLLDRPAKKKTCAAMKGLVKEGSEVISEQDPSFTRDSLLIGAAQRVEHYEMAAYGTARALAEVLERDDVADLLQETLEEEGAADKKLNIVAMDVNPAALEEADEAA